MGSLFYRLDNTSDNVRNFFGAAYIIVSYASLSGVSELDAAISSKAVWCGLHSIYYHVMLPLLVSSSPIHSFNGGTGFIASAPRHRLFLPTSIPFLIPYIMAPQVQDERVRLLPGLGSFPGQYAGGAAPPGRPTEPRSRYIIMMGQDAPESAEDGY